MEYQQLLSIVFIVCAFLVFFVLGLSFWVFSLQSRLSRLKEHYTLLLNDANVSNLQEAWDIHLARIDHLEQTADKIIASQQQIAERMKKVFQKFAIHKYDDVQDVGGKQSFLLALLNNENSGVIINSIHSRSGTRVYAKTLHYGKSDYELTDEEKGVISEAEKILHQGKNETKR